MSPYKEITIHLKEDDDYLSRLLNDADYRQQLQVLMAERLFFPLKEFFATVYSLYTRFTIGSDGQRQLLISFYIHRQECSEVDQQNLLETAHCLTTMCEAVLEEAYGIFSTFSVTIDDQTVILAPDCQFRCGHRFADDLPLLCSCIISEWEI